MDTAKNILEYMQVIHTALKQNGTWINIGNKQTRLLLSLSLIYIFAGRSFIISL
jgi:hypothetical protein